MTSLRDTIEKAAAENNGSLGALTVMSGLTDPYRIDTPANRRDAEWLAQAWEICRARRPIHLRGLHYAMVSTAWTASRTTTPPSAGSGCRPWATRRAGSA